MPSPVAAGQAPVVAGYQLDRPLGSGATAAVWRARRVGRDGPTVALKLVRPGPDAAGTARAEAAILLALDHPHVVRVYDVGGLDSSSGDDVLAIAMQYAPGGSLADLLAARGRLTPGEVVAVAAPVADALASAHRHGVVHGDVKPENVLFTSDGEPLLCDFGVARWRGEAAGGGTDGYLAPEVLAGGPPDERSDVYALGRLCLEATTGATDRVDDVDLGPPSFAAVVRRAAAADAGSRYPDAAGFAAALRAALDPDAVHLPGPCPSTPAAASPAPGRLTRTFGPRPPTPPTATRRRRGPKVALAAAVAVLTALSAAGALGLHRAGAATPPPGHATLRTCPAAIAPPAPTGSLSLRADLDGDGCPDDAAYAGGVLSVVFDGAIRRYAIGRAGDTLLLGDWDCDGRATPALYRPSSGAVVYFDGWDTTGEGLAPAAQGQGRIDGRASVRHDGHCDEVTVGRDQA